MGTIVVGVDGSTGSVQALRVAMDESRLHGSALKVVSAWHFTPIEYEATFGGVALDNAVYQEAAEELVRKTLVQAGASESGLSVSTVVRKGQAADVLCEEAEGADLLVVGSRGFGGFRGLLLGSVSQECAHHAPCAILIVPDRTRESSDESTEGRTP